MRQTATRVAADRGDAGAFTLSYVIIVPVFFAALMVIAQLTVYYLASSAALAAARQGVDAAREAHAPAGAGPSAAEAFARSTAPGYLISPAAAVVPAGSAQTIAIEVTGGVPSLVPGFPLLHVTQVAQAPVERFTTP
ncbi:MAG: hypothetical protein ACLPN6_27485 [Streptosporangiaceae bacterium]|jgi:Flp pilus assembly protein TadG|nr:hypothetical protein [Actinomycetota bacterium]